MILVLAFPSAELCDRALLAERRSSPPVDWLLYERRALENEPATAGYRAPTCEAYRFHGGANRAMDINDKRGSARRSSSPLVSNYRKVHLGKLPLVVAGCAGVDGMARDQTGLDDAASHLNPWNL